MAAAKTKPKTKTVSRAKPISKKNKTVSVKNKKYIAKSRDIISSGRRRKLPSYKSFRLHKKIRPHQPKLPSGFSILKKCLRILKNNKKLFIGIILVNIVLSLLLVNSSRSGLDIGGIKESLNGVYKGKSGSFIGLATLFGVLLTSNSAGAPETVNNSASAYQSLITMIITLATIWGLRQLTAKQKITVRDVFYKSMGPLIPFVLVLFVIGLQLMPLAIGGWLYTTIVVGGIAVTAVEKFFWVMLIFLLAILSIYMLASSIFAPFIVTLPNMAPMKALRSARQLVLHRRLFVLRKILYLPLALLFLTIVVMLPFLVYIPALAEWVFFVISIIGWLVSVMYMYTLYRELLNE